MNAIHDLCTTTTEGDVASRVTQAAPTGEATNGFWDALREANNIDYSSTPGSCLRVATDDDGVIGG